MAVTAQLILLVFIAALLYVIAIVIILAFAYLKCLPISLVAILAGTLTSAPLKL